ncbi:MAG TPA: hypothetical protein VKW08_22615 [Xanthobacteraceae bacterium]|jgi:hypothetical protein|nr:hypothetical protein [Xanthobacteraceae bacterium]
MAQYLQPYAVLAELAQTCAQQAHFTSEREVARELWRMALEYQHKAAAHDSGKPPDIGPPPSWLKDEAELRR